MNDTTPAPAIGSPEAAVRSCINLIATATDLREEQLAYWLDMYYQLRRAYEAEAAQPTDQKYIRPDDLLTTLQTLWKNTLQDFLRGESQARSEAKKKPKIEPPAEEPAPPYPAPGPELTEPNPKATGAYAAFKQEQRDRLLRVRDAGQTLAQIVKTAEGNITENQLLDILEAKRVPLAVYKVLAGVLDLMDKN